MRYRWFLIIGLISLFGVSELQGQGVGEAKGKIQVKGVFPDLTVLGPNRGRSESGIGALLPWADKLWMIGYVAHIQGSRIGLYEIDEDMTMEKHPESVTGTYANRMVHGQRETGIIGPHFISHDGQVRTSKELAGHRLTATMEHLTEPKTKVLFLTMEGLLLECEVETLEVRQLFDLVKELELGAGVRPHFKGGFTGLGRVIVANNSYDERDYRGEVEGGRLAEWDGKEWTILERAPFMEVMGKNNSTFGNPIYATGWDRRSVILKVLNGGAKEWKRYRLPKGSHSFDHAWCTEWMRIREAQTERFIMDIHGIFYELPMLIYGGEIWGIKPICYHLRIVPDFCFWRGMFVMAGDQTDHGVGQPQSGLLFGNIDDLWNYGKPTGWGAVWREDEVYAGEVSDPFLMTGFDKKTMHIKNSGKERVKFEIEVDFLGNNTWSRYKDIYVSPDEYVYEVFPDGYSGHWVRVRVDRVSKVTVSFSYN